MVPPPIRAPDCNIPLSELKYLSIEKQLLIKALGAAVGLLCMLGLPEEILHRLKNWLFFFF